MSVNKLGDSNTGSNMISLQMTGNIVCISASFMCNCIILSLFILDKWKINYLEQKPRMFDASKRTKPPLCLIIKPKTLTHVVSQAEDQNSGLGRRSPPYNYHPQINSVRSGYLGGPDTANTFLIAIQRRWAMVRYLLIKLQSFPREWLFRIVVIWIVKLMMLVMVANFQAILNSPQEKKCVLDFIDVRGRQCFEYKVSIQVCFSN